MKTFDTELENRIIAEALYTIENDATVRYTAAKFGISKTTVHKDMTKKLYDISYSLYTDVSKVLKINKDERAKRGGIATKNKYEKCFT